MATLEELNEQSKNELERLTAEMLIAMDKKINQLDENLEAVLKMLQEINQDLKK